MAKTTISLEPNVKVTVRGELAREVFKLLGERKIKDYELVLFDFYGEVFIANMQPEDAVELKRWLMLQGAESVE